MFQGRHGLAINPIADPLPVGNLRLVFLLTFDPLPESLDELH
jgi:hypothetical protein